ncbi:hypothetical protein JTB14_029584 [Gonioctena quinquepunctata]|nr:hypothetical protein JTB14_029584 [Gonioctena quinquepunctata]
MQEIDDNERSNTDTPVYQTIPEIREDILSQECLCSATSCQEGVQIQEETTPSATEVDAPSRITCGCQHPSNRNQHRDEPGT